MNRIVTAKDVVPPGQRAVVVFTRGGKLIFDKKGEGSTGNWKVSLSKMEKVDKVVIYLREARQNGGNILMGDYVGYEPSPEQGRYIFLFSHLNEAGFTKSNWFEFGGVNQNPVSFLNYLLIT
jgi:hypothetical protein